MYVPLGGCSNCEFPNRFLFLMGKMRVSRSSCKTSSRPAMSFQETVMLSGSTRLLAIESSYSENCFQNKTEQRTEVYKNILIPTCTLVVIFSLFMIALACFLAFSFLSLVGSNWSTIHLTAKQVKVVNNATRKIIDLTSSFILVVRILFLLM